MAYGHPVCASCGAGDGIEEHHLYLKADGCPDDLTVWLCHSCHGRAHGLKRRLNIGAATKAGLAAAKARGVKLGNPGLLARDPEAVAKIHATRRANYRTRLRGDLADWLATIHTRRPDYTWEEIATALNYELLEHRWNKENLRRAMIALH